MGGITNAKAKQKYGEYADGSIIKFDKAPDFTKVYDKSKQVDKGGFFKNISANGIKQLGALKNAYEKSRKEEEKGNIEKANEIIEKAFTKHDNTTKKEIYNAWQKSKY